MELDAPDGKLFVAQAHNLAFGPGFGGDLERLRQRVAFDEKRVITGGRERVGHAFKQIAAIVINRRSLAVHETLGTHHFAAENVAHALVAEANPEGGRGRAEGLDDVVGQSGFARRTGTGGDEDPGRFEGANLVQGDFVVAANLHLHAQFAEVLDEVVGKAVVIVDD